MLALLVSWPINCLCPGLMDVMTYVQVIVKSILTSHFKKYVYVCNGGSRKHTAYLVSNI